MTKQNGASRPIVVELVGPAGVGKSALAERLLARHDVVRASVWNLPRALLLESGVRSLPQLLRLCLVTRSLPREELKQIVRLNALRLFVRRRVAGARVVVLDEGPVFALSWLRVFGHPRLQNGRAEPWWRATYAVWAVLLDRLVLLDAPEPVLTSRIRGRHKPADVFRQMADGEIRDLVARYRIAFERVLGGLARAGGPSPVMLATTETTPGRLGDAVLELLAERPRG
ncbi:MAG TPA: AAA family ATPase [Gemmatimonadales bacterium]|nr:AAA family ATPase [Gemmatimonadales bacterium]